MQKEVTCCDSCEKILTRGGIRMYTGTDGETVDLCPDCLTAVLPDYADRTRTSFLKVQISRDDYAVLAAKSQKKDASEDDSENGGVGVA
ncbi:MAG: hypothetical protein WBG50_16035 [Desulfomonilaceae bacterium]